MLIAGARGHAVEVLELLHGTEALEAVCFYDDQNPSGPVRLFDRFPVLRSLEEARRHFEADARFVLGLGGPQARRLVVERLRGVGGEHIAVSASTARAGHYGVHLTSVDRMDAAWVSNNVRVGEGTLLNRGCAVHHDSTVGPWCEIGPGAQLLGRVRLGESVAIGAGACVVPGCFVGAAAIVGAGAVVTHDVPPGEVWAGVPARPMSRG